MNRRRCDERDIVEEAVAELRKRRDDLESWLPAKVILHLPPPTGREKVVVEVHLKLRD